ncbi:hypothetical protein [Synechococcus sp. M16CYN]|uniref:hypothetical protein n=1 Tax=Synechococcus sp. M16CYN TaxID=3103139 RepID=UPI00324993C9
MKKKVNVGQLFARCYRSLSEFFEFVLNVTSDHEERLLELEMRTGIPLESQSSYPNQT